jgi:hypothetical protein
MKTNSFKPNSFKPNSFSGAALLTASAILALPLALAGCSPTPAGSLEEQTSEADPHTQFLTALASHCGEAFAGALVSNDEADADMRGQAMVMHVAECSDDAVAIPFHIQEQDGSWNRSRTWQITRAEAGLRLKHRHGHEDGTLDTVTNYGGDTQDAGAATAQDFLVDEESIAMFEREGLTASVTNVWRVEIDPAGTEDARFAYQLKRTTDGGAPENRLFRVEFDLTQPVETPPKPW